MAGLDAFQVEGEAQDVALGEEVGSVVEVCGDVVRCLGLEDGEEFADGSGEGGRGGLGGRGRERSFCLGRPCLLSLGRDL